ncbi:MAG: amidohydrolase [Firmicutes bacterium]|nr:amidohydrolase [Bacillota bacterium]
MLLIKNGKIFTITGDIINKGSILVENGRIKEIGKDIVAPLDAEVIDAEGKVVMPGFIEAHCHLGIHEEGIGFEGNDGNEAVNPVTPHLRGIDGINPMDGTLKEAYEAGITCACTGPGSANVVGGQFVTIKTYGDRVDDMVVQNPSAMKIAFGENPKRVYNSQKKSPTTRMAVAAILRETLFKAKEYNEKLELAKEDKSKKPDFDMELDAMAKVIRKEIPLKAHAHRADDIFTAIRIAKEFDVDITLDHCSEGHMIIDHLVEEDKAAIIGPTLGHRGKFETKNKTFETPGILNRAGIKVAITTDAPVVPLQHLPICAGKAVDAGMDEMEALRAITIYPAEILGISDRVGSLEIGKDADIVIFDGNPILDVDCKTYATIINGKVVYKN